MENIDVDHSQFKSKRAGHYNEFLVVQAMRAKMAAGKDSDEEEGENA